ARTRSETDSGLEFRRHAVPREQPSTAAGRALWFFRRSDRQGNQREVTSGNAAFQNQKGRGPKSERAKRRSRATRLYFQTSRSAMAVFRLGNYPLTVGTYSAIVIPPRQVRHEPQTKAEDGTLHNPKLLSAVSRRCCLPGMA